MKTVTVLPKIC